MMSLAEFACGYEQAGLNFTLVLHVSLRYCMGLLGGTEQFMISYFVLVLMACGVEGILGPRARWGHRSSIGFSMYSNTISEG
jgi:hypothetical protein